MSDTVTRDFCDERHGDVKEIALSAHKKTSFWRNIGGTIIVFFSVTFCTTVLGLYLMFNSIQADSLKGDSINDKKIELLKKDVQYTAKKVEEIQGDMEKMKQEILDEIRKSK